MLVLTRRPMEQIVINDNIVITLVDVGDGRAKIGIEAPKEVGVWRRELYDHFHTEASEDETNRPLPAEPARPVGLE